MGAYEWKDFFRIRMKHLLYLFLDGFLFIFIFIFMVATGEGLVCEIESFWLTGGTKFDMLFR